MSLCVADCLVCRLESSCIPDCHPQSVTNTKCCIDTVISPDDGHTVARNMYRSEIHILSRILHLAGFICKKKSYLVWAEYLLTDPGVSGKQTPRPSECEVVLFIFKNLLLHYRKHSASLTEISGVMIRKIVAFCCFVNN